MPVGGIIRAVADRGDGHRVLHRSVAGWPDGRRAVFVGSARLRVDLQSLRRIQFCARRNGVVRGAGDGAPRRMAAGLDRYSCRISSVGCGIAVDALHHDSARDGDRKIGPAAAGESGRRRAADGDVGRDVFSRRLRSNHLGIGYLQNRSRHRQGTDDDSRVHFSWRYSAIEGRCHCNGHCGGTGHRPGAVFSENTDWSRLACGRRRSSGGAVDRHPAQPHLGHRLGGGRRRGTGGRHDLGVEAGRAVFTFADCVESVAGRHPRWPHLDSRRDYRRTHYWCRRESGGGFPEPDSGEDIRSGRRWHRKLVCVCVGVAVLAGTARRAVR